VLFALALAAAWWSGRQEEGMDALATGACTVAGLFLALGAGQLIAHSVARVRPYYSIAGVHVLVARSGDFSFPSDHATMAGAVAAGLWLVDRRLGAVTAVLAVLMALARVYVGAHYPGDVVAGLALGAVVTVALNALAARHVARLLSRLAETPAGLLVGAGGRTERV